LGCIVGKPSSKGVKVENERTEKARNSEEKCNASSVLSLL